MFTTDSPVNVHFIKWAGPIIQDIERRRRVEWVDRNVLDGSRKGTLRGYSDNGGDDIRNAIVRVTLDSGWELEVSFLELMNAAYNCGYARR